MQKKYLDWSSMSPMMRLAVAEIYQSYGDYVRIGRKSLRKYGSNANVSTSGDYDIVPWCDGTPLQETYLTDNTIDSLSSSSAADTNVPIYIEGMTRSGDELTFVTQVVNTDASDGQTRVALTTPLCDVTRERGVTAGSIYVYENTTISGGVPTDQSKVHGVLAAGKNSSLNAKTSIAKTNYFILTSYWASVGKAAGNAAIDITPFVAKLGDAVLDDAFVGIDPWSVSLGTSADGPRIEPYTIIRPNSRIVLRGSASSGTIAVNAGFAGFFADIVEPDLATLGDDGYEINL